MLFKVMRLDEITNEMSTDKVPSLIFVYSKDRRPEKEGTRKGNWDVNKKEKGQKKDLEVKGIRKYIKQGGTIQVSQILLKG